VSAQAKKTYNLLKERNISPKICEKGCRNYPLTDEQKESNRIKSKTRSRVEHVFSFVTQNMHGFFCRNIGFKRIKGVIGLINLFYNIFRYEQILRLQPVRAKLIIICKYNILIDR
jgi:hypothetical protein